MYVWIIGRGSSIAELCGDVSNKPISQEAKNLTLFFLNKFFKRWEYLEVDDVGGYHPPIISHKSGYEAAEIRKEKI